MRLASLSLALVVLAPFALAQTTSTSSTIPVGNPTYLGTYDLESGTITPPGGAEGTALIYDNIAFMGSFFQPGPGTVNMDFGTKASAPFDFATRIQFGYGTTSAGPVDMLLRTHSAAAGFGSLGTVESAILVTGLPGSAVAPGAEAFAFDIDLKDAAITFNLPDGPIGYSYEFFDVDTGPLLVGPPNPAGVIDAFDQYLSDLSYVGTFFFGGFPAFPFASFYWQMDGDDTDPANECFLVFGGGVGSDFFVDNIHGWETQLSGVEESWAVLMDDIPEFVLEPNVNTHGTAVGHNGNGPVHSTDLPPVMWDGSFTLQILLWNPGVFPELPEQFSHGLKVHISPDGTVRSRQFGEGTGIEVWAETYVNAEGKTVLRFPFTVPGM